MEMKRQAGENGCAKTFIDRTLKNKNKIEKVPRISFTW
jgi:hypothetical protein